MIDTVPVDAAGVLVTVTMPARHLCPFVDEVDDGEVTIKWVTGDRTVELHSLRRWLSTWADVPVAHEAMAADVYAALHMPGVTPVSVTWTGSTAGGVVTAQAGGDTACGTSPTPPARQLTP